MKTATGRDNNRRRSSKPKPTEHVQLGMSDPERRQALKLNIVRGYGKPVQFGPHVKYTVGIESFGYVEYLIINSKLPDHVHI